MTSGCVGTSWDPVRAVHLVCGMRHELDVCAIAVAYGLAFLRPNGRHERDCKVECDFPRNAECDKRRYKLGAVSWRVISSDVFMKSPMFSQIAE